MIVVEDDPVSLVLIGLPKRWNNYQDSVNWRENILEGAFVVQLGARRDSVKHQRWDLIQISGRGFCIS